MMLATCTKSLRKQRTNWCVKVVIRSIPKVIRMLLVPCRHIMKISWKSDDVFVSNIPSRHKFPQNTLTRWWFRTSPIYSRLLHVPKFHEHPLIRVSAELQTDTNPPREIEKHLYLGCDSEHRQSFTDCTITNESVLNSIEYDYQIGNTPRPHWNQQDCLQRSMQNVI